MSNALIKLKFLEDSAKSNNLDEILNALCAFGVPMLSKFPNGWWCKIEMHVAAKGCAVRCESETSHKTPSLAVAECVKRTVETFNQFKS